MPFPEKIREYDLAAQGGQCQTMVYTEESGWHICGSTVHLEDDHLDPESKLLEEGETDPNHSDGIIRCRTHHTGDGLTAEDEGGNREIAPYGHPQWSRHPDMGQARKDYWKDPDSFKKVAMKHREMVAKGERITNDDEGVTEFERERVQEMEASYFSQTKEPKPEVKEHPRFKNKHWIFGVFSKDGDDE